MGSTWSADRLRGASLPADADGRVAVVVGRAAEIARSTPITSRGRFKDA